MTLKVTFWGVRGTIACPSPRHMQFGGNTSCVHVKAGDLDIVLDAGTGIRGLGQQFLRDGVTSATVLFTHTHWDHINGFPFFAPAFRAGNRFRVLAGHLPPETGGIRATMAGQMAQPMFPVPLEAMRADLAFEDFQAGDDLVLAPDVVVKTAKLNHPNGATGYRIEHGGHSFCYVTDTEHVPGKPDENVLALIEGADLVAYDSTYTDDEFPAKVGWGHSTWQEAVRLATRAHVKRLSIFHHDPDHDDETMTRIEGEARALFPAASVAREGEIIVL